ncbi:type B DNA-directed DNA polymerase [Halobacterium rubrum]|uniref:type B DNA-directed DNA polymerase n=1 Tax=Halobacterium TaxID=2239 RepID=UPI001F31D5AB|nr:MULTISPECIES: type B DNA-directed DNA polymerase [Halobacterium]MDH5021827.1 type B DNA-directed DNA polymerase [Halobacterium rubrum]
MVLTTEFLDTGGVRYWELTDDGATASADRQYRPRLYVRADDRHSLSDLREYLGEHPVVAGVEEREFRPGWREDYEPMLRVAVDRLHHLTEIAEQVAQYGRPGGYQCYNVDFSREFRYCLETGRDAVPARELDVLRVAAPRAQVAGVDPLREVSVGELTFEGVPEVVAADVSARIRDRDPDVLQVSSADLIPRLFATAPVDEDVYALGRRPGYTKRAGASTYESYGQVEHSPARYSIPGRVIVDESNSFFLEEAGLSGILDLVERSGKPLQEAAWASIGNILTAIQIQYAADRDVLVPWRSWRTERFKTASQLDAADRGGFTFEPDVGVHKTVHELDFSSLYPNIIREHNISPETIRCDCHPDREDVPGLGYSICPDDGYLPEVLSPIIDDRADIKDELATTDDPDRVEELEARSAALKWILVSCFGYQGFSNAKFGRIEAHEAINAYAREILLDAKAAFEEAGYRVVHGIIDSIWVQPREDVEQEPVEAVAREVSEATGIELEHEGVYDWVAFCPTADGRDGALTKYFGRQQSGEYKYRGLECRQRSTPPWIADLQRELIEVYDETRETDAVLARVLDAIGGLRAGRVEPGELAIRNRVTKTPAEYGHETRNVAALRRAEDSVGGIAPGEDVEYVVVDDEKASRDRVELRSEDPQDYDTEFYVELVARAAAGVLGPFGYTQEDVISGVESTQQLELTTPR